MRVDPDGQAFPMTSGDPAFSDTNGMTIRTWLTGMAMQGILTTGRTDFAVVIDAAGIADAQLAELNKEPQP